MAPYQQLVRASLGLDRINDGSLNFLCVGMRWDQIIHRTREDMGLHSTKNNEVPLAFQRRMATTPSLIQSAFKGAK